MRVIYFGTINVPIDLFSHNRKCVVQVHGGSAKCAFPVNDASDSATSDKVILVTLKHYPPFMLSVIQKLSE